LRSRLFIFSILIFLSSVAAGQKDTAAVKSDSLTKKAYVLHEVDRNGVKMPEIEIKEVQIHVRPTRAQRREFREYDRLVSNIKRVYPYAVLVRSKLREVNEHMKGIEGERERKKYLKEVEKDVFKEYQADIEDMTITQGRLLIKLIDRETQNTSFDLIRDYRGKLSAAFWQGIARIFGTNLKEQYDPYGEDSLIELIINEIDAGRL
jgi:hypothetical protein